MTGIETPTGGILDRSGCVCHHEGRLYPFGNATGEIFCLHCLAVWYPGRDGYRLTAGSWHLLHQRRRDKARQEDKPGFIESSFNALAAIITLFSGLR